MGEDTWDNCRGPVCSLWSITRKTCRRGVSINTEGMTLIRLSTPSRKAGHRGDPLPVAETQARRLLVLAGLSGSCGLAWEVVYARLLANYFGNGFEITGFVLASVFLGMAFGAWNSRLLLSRLAWIELIVGVWSIAIAAALSVRGFDIVTALGLGWGRYLLLTTMLVPPMALIGACVPVFSHALESKNATGGSGFVRIYMLYNAGAFLSVMAIEFVLLRGMGLLWTGVLVGALNVSISAVLFASGSVSRNGALTGAVGRVQPRIGLALIYGSFASGMFQLLVLKLSFSVFGPLQENFAIVLAAAILGVAAGAMMARKGAHNLASVLGMSILAVLLFLLNTSLVVHGWGWINALALPDVALGIAKLFLLGGPPFCVFVIFGMLVPVAVKAHGTSSGSVGAVAGRVLAFSSLGNGLGALFMFLWLYRLLSLQAIFVVICAVLGLGLFLLRRSTPEARSRGVGFAAVAGLMAAAGVMLWPGKSLLLGYRALQNAELSARQRDLFSGATIYKAYDQDAALVDFSDGSRALMFNGYRSLTFGPQARSHLHEVVVGATPALFSAQTDRALVLGLGTGITGGSTARLYGQTTIVEINPAILNIPAHFGRENAGILSRMDTEILLRDGISMLQSDGAIYDAIVNTVTSPKFYSASKLYTQDFYDLVTKRLARGGVYSSWFDLNIDLDGMAVMLNTLENSFAHCRYFLLARGYFNVLCSNDPLIYLPSTRVEGRLAGTGISDIFSVHGYPREFRNVLPDLEMEFSEPFFVRRTDALNTLDRPVIEFMVSWPEDMAAASDALSQSILANIEFRRKTSFGQNGWRSACNAMAWMSRLQFSGC